MLTLNLAQRSILVIALISTPTLAWCQLEIIAFEGEVGTMPAARVFDTPGVNNNGEVAYFALPADEGRSLFFYDGVQTQTLLAGGTPAPDGNGQFFQFVEDPVLSNTQKVAFRGSVYNTIGGLTDSLGVFLVGGDEVSQLAREGQPTPGGSYEFDNFLAPLINDSGQVAFEARLRGPGTFGLRQAIYRYDGAVLEEVARFDTVPTGGLAPLGVMTSLDSNNLGNVAFVAQSTDEFGQNEGPFRSVFMDDGTGLTRVAEQGQPFGSSGLFFDTFTGATLNDVGTIQFRASLVDGDGLDMGGGLVRKVGEAFSPVVLEGDSTPDGLGVFTEIGMSYTQSEVNDAGATPFWARFTTPAGDSKGLFLASSEGVVEVVRMGDLTPDGNGEFGIVGTTFGGFGDLSEINAEGQFAFSARLSETAGGQEDDYGVYLYDGARVVTIAREGQTIEAGVIDRVTSNTSAQRARINESGQAVFQFRVEGGATGAALFTPVEYLAGDFDADGSVDAADYAIWRETEGATNAAHFSGADGDGDGHITPADYDIWRAEYGSSTLALGATAPEPNSLVFLALACCRPLAVRQRRLTFSLRKAT